MQQPSGGNLDTQWEDDEWLVSPIHFNGDYRLLVRSRVVERPGTLARLDSDETIAQAYLREARKC